MRSDIQCLRGIAISFVFLYHLFPTLFVNGFLGVDIFFVISGYLMAKNLTDNPISKVSDVALFYYRRFKRIMPLYYLVILVFVVLIHFYLGDFFWENNRRYSLASLFLVTNQLIIHDSHDYFSEFILDGSSRNAFLHLWSLSVEMQFYLFVPFIFLALQLLKTDTLRLIAVSILVVAVLIPFTQINVHFAFNFMFLRLWQFAAGFVALFWTRVHDDQNLGKMEKEKQEKDSIMSKGDIVMTCLVLICSSLIPYKISALILRPLVTFSTAVIIAVGGQDNQLLKSKYLSHLGNISYAFYLIHWPVICLFIGSPLRAYVFCFLITVASSILVHHLFEKIYLKMNMIPVISLIVFLIASNDILQYSIRTHDLWVQKLRPDLQKIVNDNRDVFHPSFTSQPFNEECTTLTSPAVPNVTMKVFGHCQIKRGHGNISVSVIGNSYSLNLLRDIQQNFNQNYSDFRFLGIESSDALISTDYVTERILEFFQQHVELYKPDVLIIVSRHFEQLREGIEEDDVWMNQIEQSIAFYEKFAKKVYILGSHPLYSLNFLSSFLHFATQKPDDIESLHLDKKESDYYMRNAIRRFKLLKCRNCQVFDVSFPFVENGKYLTFDREKMMSYVDNTVHFTVSGCQKMGPAFEKLTRDIFANF